MGEAGLAARSASEIELISILALGNTDARWHALSRLPQKVVPLPVRVVLGSRHRRPTSHHRSIFPFPFVLSLVLSHLVSFALISVCIITPVACLGLCGIIRVMLLVEVVP